MNSIKRTKPVILSLLLMVLSYTSPAQTPQIAYSTYLGGSGWDYGHAITVDKQGYAYIAGQANSSNYPATVGAFDRTANGGADILVTKLNREGSALVYSTYIGGSAFEDTRKVFVDKAGCVYLTGTTQSSNFPIGSDSLAGSSNGYFLKLNSAGDSIVFSSRWVGGEKILVDSEGYLIILGSTGSTTFPTTENAYSRTLAGGDDLFVVKIDTTNKTIIFSTLIGGSANEWAPSFTLDAQNNIIITGQTYSDNYPVTGNVFANYVSGKSNVFVTKLKSDGTQLLYSTIIGGSDDEWSFDVTADNNNNAYITGVTTSNDFPVSAAAFDSQYSGGQDAFLFKINADGSQLVYSTYIGGSDKDGGRGVVVDKNGKAYLTGCTKSNNFTISSNAYDTTFNGAGTDQWAWGDPFFLIMNPAGTQIEYSTYFGGSNDEEAYGIAMDTLGDIYLCGVTSSNNFPTTQGAYDRTINGGGNIYVTKFVFSQQLNIEKSSFIDIRDGQIYNTVKIGDQWWMAENLRATRYRNGDTIETTSPATLNISSQSTPKYQWVFENNQNDLAVYGRLYTWYAVTDSRNIAPDGWHVPTNAEWTTLINFLGGDSIAGGKLKEADTTHWKSPNTGATNESGFTALPGGCRPENGEFDGGGNFVGEGHHYGAWWSSSEKNFSKAWNRYVGYNDAVITFFDNTYGYDGKKWGFSVRCVKDAPTGVDDSKNGKMIPAEMKLNQNYPNPFNPSTTISYYLSASANVKLTVYNMIGQKIKTLVDGFQSIGEHLVTWDATNNSNNPVCSGFYFYSLTSDASTVQKKMMLIR